MPQLDVADFSITLEPRSQYYSFSAYISQSWVVIADPGVVLDLVEVYATYIGAATPKLSGFLMATLSLERDQSHGGQTTTAPAASQAPVAPTKGIDFRLSAVRLPGVDGWDFCGKAGDDQIISFDELILALAKKFGVNSARPAILSGLAINDLMLQFDTVQQEFQFSCGLQIVIGSRAIDAIINVDVRRHSSAFDINFNGTLQLGGAYFELTFNIGSVTDVAGTWRSTDGRTLGFADIAKALGIDAPVDVPAGLDFSLKAASFSYNATQQAFVLSAESAQFGDAFFVTARGLDGKLGFVFGVDTPHAGHLSSLPGIGGDLKAADFLTFQQVSFLMSSGTFQSFAIPALPVLPGSQPGSPGTGVAMAGRPIAPLARGASLQLTPGLSLAAGMTFATASSDRRMANLASIVGQPSLLLQVTLGKDLLKFFCALTGTIWIPAGGGNQLALSNPGVEIDITVVPPVMAVQLAGGVSFNALGMPIAAAARMMISETEAQVACTLAVGQPGAASQMTVPGLGALPVGNLGVEMGTYFEPPGVDLGVQGKLQIGQGAAEHTCAFAVVMEMVEEVPNPLYLSFYLDKLTLADVLAMYMPYMTLYEAEAATAAAAVTKVLAPDIYNMAVSALQLVEATDLSFHWCDSVVILPDGTVAQPGFGFSAGIQILDLAGYAELEIGAAQGLHGKAEMTRINLRDILVIEGDGQGIKRTPPAPGAAPPNNAILRGVPRMPSDWVVQPGGPILQFNAAGAPFLHANFMVTLFDAVRTAVDVTVSPTGFSFLLSFQAAGVAKFDVACVLAGPTHFSAGGDLVIRTNGVIGPIKIKGVNVGSLTLAAVDVATALSISLDPSTFSMSLSGHFQFEGASLTVPTVALSVAPKSVAELPGLMLKIIQDDADRIFLPLLGDAEKWADMVGRGVVTGVTDMAGTLQKAYGASAQQAAQLMHSAKQSAETVAAGLKTTYGQSAEQAAALLRGAGFATNEVGSALRAFWNVNAHDAAQALKSAGFAVDQVGDFAKKFDPRHWKI